MLTRGVAFQRTRAMMFLRSGNSVQTTFLSGQKSVSHAAQLANYIQVTGDRSASTQISADVYSSSPLHAAPSDISKEPCRKSQPQVQRACARPRLSGHYDC